MYVSGPTQLRGSVEPAMGTVESYLSAINKIKDQFGVQGETTISDIIDLPNVFGTTEQTLDEASTQLVVKSVEDLVDTVLAARKQEGAVLKEDIMKRVTLMEQEIAAIEENFKQAIAEQKEKIQAILQDVESDENKLADIQKNAMYVMLDKMDINEEIVRFKSHLANLKEQLESDTVEKGKRLDFTLQELGREINTIAAKASNAAMGSHAINVKVELEKAREQTQNIV